MHPMKEFELQPSTSEVSLNLDAELNDEQRRVVLEGDGPCLVLAGAGSGKTRTITYRVAYLLGQGIPAEQILLLTFTNKAAREMLSRVEDILGHEPTGLWGGTFHSVANRILRRHADKIGYTSSFTILDSEDQKALLKGVIKEKGIDTKNRRFPSPAVLLSIISYARNADESIEDVVERQHEPFTDLIPTIFEIAKEYEQKKREGNAMDFDDLLLQLLRLFQEHPSVLRGYADQFRFILVDEFQDTNTIQASLIRHLAGIHRNLLVVGDDAQSIYSFRAANIQNILGFKDWFPSPKIFHLTKNYRSTPEILQVANHSIAHNLHQYEKALQATRAAADRPSYVPATSSEQEAEYIAQQILALHAEGAPLSHMAVLFRSSFHSQQLEMQLTKRNVPYEYRGGLRFFERAHIKDVVAYLRLLANVRDETAWMRTLGHQVGIGAVTAQKIYHVASTGEDLADVVLRALEIEAMLSVRAKAGWGSFVKTLERLLGRTGVADTIRAVVASPYRDHLEMEYPDYRERLEDIEQFALFAEPYDSLDDFLAEVTLYDGFGAERPPRDANEDRLVLSTVHQAKGLEWDAVFVMRLHEGGFPHKRSLEDADAIEEERRLFYVACTRARTHLFLTSPLASGFDTLMFHQPSTFLQELPKALLEEVRLKRAEAPSRRRRAGWGYDEPTIVLDANGETVSVPPKSLLRSVDEL